MAGQCINGGFYNRGGGAASAGAAETLAQTLAKGNVTGGTDIEVTNGDNILLKGTVAAQDINLRNINDIVQLDNDVSGVPETMRLGDLFVANTSGGQTIRLEGNNAELSLGNATNLVWSSTASAANAPDIGFARDAAGVIRVSDASTGVGDIRLQDILSQNPTTDVAVTDMRIEGADALAAAVTNQDGANILIIPGANATGGGTDGQLHVFHPDEAANNFTRIYRTTAGGGEGHIQSALGALRLQGPVGAEITLSGTNTDVILGARLDIAAGPLQFRRGAASPEIILTDQNADAAPSNLRIVGSSALASAVTNQDGGNVDVVPGANATGGGTDGVLRVWHADEGANDYISVSHDGTDGTLSTGAGDLVLTAATGFTRRSTTAAITASTTQTQGQGPLTTEINEVATVANANDTVTLPSAAAGRNVIVINNGANTLQIFPASGDDLGAGVDTATTLATATNVHYVAYDSTNWESI